MKSMTKPNFKMIKGYLGFFLILCIICVFPFVVNPDKSYLAYFLFLTFIYIAISQAWNLVGGYAGQVSFGQHAFFGIGAYLTAFSWLGGLTGFLDPLAMMIGGMGAALLAILVGLPLLSKLKGDYFALGTLGLGEILRAIFIQGTDVTGGTEGLMLSSSSYESLLPYYFISLIIVVLTCLTVWILVSSPIGLALVAIRDDEQAAAANGIAVLKFKVLAFSLGAFFTGLCGSIYGYYLFHIEPHAFFNLSWALLPLVMTILGGIGTFLGPIIGAVVLAVIVELANIFLPEIQSFLYGASIVLLILVLPHGIMNVGKKGTKLSVLRKLLPGRISSGNPFL
jgi:branched-chain amino acid transport system permease protein